MKSVLLLCIILGSAVSMMRCSPENKDISMTKTEPVFDAQKAEIYGADAYGMRSYVIAFLRRGPNRDLSPEESSRLQTAHLKNIQNLAAAGKLALAGPFLDDGELRGLYVFSVESLEEARVLTESDPAVQAGSLVMELKAWYGSAALMAVNDIHATLQSTPVVEE